MNVRDMRRRTAVATVGWFVATATCAAPVTYTAFVVTDVSLNGQQMHNVPVTLKLVGDTANVEAFDVTSPDGRAGSGWQLTKGAATVQIVNGTQVIHARFLPGQILIALDSANGGAGFSSLVGADHHLEPGYPLGLTGTTVGGMIDIVTTGAWSGHAWSCIGYPPALGLKRCGDAKVYPLQTNLGPFVIFMPYYATDASGLIVNDYEGALNDATFTVRVDP